MEGTENECRECVGEGLLQGILLCTGVDGNDLDKTESLECSKGVVECVKEQDNGDSTGLKREVDCPEMCGRLAHGKNISLKRTWRAIYSLLVVKLKH